MSAADLMMDFFLQLFKAVLTIISDPMSPMFYTYGVILGLMILIFVACLISLAHKK